MAHIEELVRQATSAEVAARHAAQEAGTAREGLEGTRQAMAALEAALDAREAKLRDSWHALRAQLAELAGEEMPLVPHSDVSLVVRV